MLLHDAPEYVIGDMISPFKAVIGDAYKAVEARLLAAIHLRFGLQVKRSEELERIIKTADRGAAFLEATRLGIAAGEGISLPLFMIPWHDHLDWTLEEFATHYGFERGPDAGWDYSDDLCRD